MESGHWGRGWARLFCPFMCFRIIHTISWLVISCTEQTADLHFSYPFSISLVCVCRSKCVHTSFHPGWSSISFHHHFHCYTKENQILIQICVRNAMGPTHHFIIDFMKMDLADFLHHILNFKCHKAKTCGGDKWVERIMARGEKEEARNRKEGEEGKLGHISTKA